MKGRDSTEKGMPQSNTGGIQENQHFEAETTGLNVSPFP